LIDRIPGQTPPVNTVLMFFWTLVMPVGSTLGFVVGT
jgi:hypothetical protein